MGPSTKVESVSLTLTLTAWGQFHCTVCLLSFFSAPLQFSQFCPNFKPFRPEHLWRDFISWNVHSFIFLISMSKFESYRKSVYLMFSHKSIVPGVRIRVRIDFPHLLRVVRGDQMGRSFGWNSRCGTIKIPSCSKALSIGLNFAALHR
jgi:hypothetical protein